MSVSMRAALFDEEINRLLRETAEALPDLYEISISLINDEGSITLYDSDGNHVEVHAEDMDFAESLGQYVKTAIEHASSESQEVGQ